MWNSSNAFSFFLNLPSRLSQGEEKCLFLWKKHGHCFINLQEPTPINHVTATQFLLNSSLNVINTTALNNYLNEDKKLFQHGSTEMRSTHLGKGGLQTEGCQTLVTSLTGFAYARDAAPTQNRRSVFLQVTTGYQTLAHLQTTRVQLPNIPN